MTEQSLSGTYIPIPIDKPVGLRIIVAAMEVIQLRFRIKIIPAIPEGVQVADMGGAGDLLSIGILVLTGY